MYICWRMHDVGGAHRLIGHLRTQQIFSCQFIPRCLKPMSAFASKISEGFGHFLDCEELTVNQFPEKMCKETLSLT